MSEREKRNSLVCRNRGPVLPSPQNVGGGAAPDTSGAVVAADPMDEEAVPETSDLRVLIWDLDECFWTGTLDDAGPPPRPITRNCALVKSLAARGVVSSICSRNDPSAVRVHLQGLGMWDWFVFASIAWEMPSKGAAISATLQALGVQARHVLFVDDSAVNRADARAGGVCAVPPHALEGVDPLSWGRADPECTRLVQYRGLQARPPPVGVITR